MKRFFELSPQDIKIRNTLTNQCFLEIEIYAISTANPNRNGSHFTLDSLKSGIDSFLNKPIVGEFSNVEGDMVAHGGTVRYDPQLKTEYWDNKEQILGFIRGCDEREIVERDGLYWVKCTAFLYTQYNYKAIKKILTDRRKKVSVEVEILKSEDLEGTEYIYQFNLIGITILGTENGRPVIEGIPGAHLSILDRIDELYARKQTQQLNFAYQELDGQNIDLEKSKKEVYAVNKKDKQADEKVVKMAEENLEADGTFKTQMEEGDIADDKDISKCSVETEEESDDKTVKVEVEVEIGEEEDDDDDEGADDDNDELKMAQEKCTELQAAIDALTIEKECWLSQEVEYKSQLASYAKFEKELEKEKEAHGKTMQKYEAAQTEISTIRKEKQTAFAQGLIEQMKLSSDDSKTVFEKINLNLFTNNESIEKEVAYLAFKKGTLAKSVEQPKKETFKTNISQPEIIVKEVKKNDSNYVDVDDKLAAYVSKTKK